MGARSVLQGKSAENTPASPATSLTLLQRVRDRDPTAWQQQLFLYGPLVYQWCRRWQLQPAAAADVAQEVFQAVANRIGQFRRDRPGDTFRGWLWTLTRNHIGNHFHRRAAGPEGAGGTNALVRLLELPEGPPDEDREGRPPNTLVQRALQLVRDEFEEQTWRTFTRVVVDGVPPRELADELGVTPEAVRKVKSRVLRRLRELLDDPARPPG